MYDTYHMIRIQTSVIQYCTVLCNYSGLSYDTYFKRLLHWKKKYDETFAFGSLYEFLISDIISCFIFGMDCSFLTVLSPSRQVVSQFHVFDYSVP